MSCGIYRIIQLNNAIKSAKIIIIDSSDADSTNNCQFSWSVDGVCWTGWTNYENYLRITKKIESDFYLRIRINFGLKKLVVNNIERMNKKLYNYTNHERML